MGDLTFNDVSRWLMTANLWMLLAIGLPIVLFLIWLCVRYIPHNRVGVVEKLWSFRGSLNEGRIIALRGEAGYQAQLLRGGLHFGYWRWQYRIHKTRLVTIPQGEIGYLYARDGEPLSPSQTLGRVVSCNNAQDATAFLDPSLALLLSVVRRDEQVASDAITERTHHSNSFSIRGQRGRQRAILREGVYAINPALFVVITSSDVFALPQIQEPHERKAVSQWQKELRDVNGFQPVVIGRHHVLDGENASESASNDDNVGIVTIHDGPSLPTGELIAPPVGPFAGLSDNVLPAHRQESPDHNNYQDPEAFLDAGGRRGRQYQTLTDGTYFINRWFASVETIPKTVVPIGHVGVVVSYYGRTGRDVSGDSFRHGEQVAEGERGVWERPLGPGKYAFNTYAGNIVLVPTTNFVLHWITGRTESHSYDENLKSIELVTRDAYEPSLPLSVVVHIDYQRAPSVIQRFGDVKKLITQTLDPLLSAYFRDIAHKHTMLALLHERDLIQRSAQEELKRRFHEFDIECVDVLIGKPDADHDGKIESLLDQLRTRQLSIEQLETYERQREANDKLRVLNEAKAQAEMQTSMTNARLQVQIAESKGDADVAVAKRQNDRAIMVTQTELTNTKLKVQMAECEGDAEVARARRHAEQVRLLAEAESQKSRLAGRGEAQRILQEGLAEASVLQRKIASYGDSRLFALTMASKELAHATQPLVPERLFTMSNGQEEGVP
ncbi:MAG: hypothetical protein FJ267_03350, partial [Planctomycetes bacterium]|nr:hypothetical protein [Planctomycetota bacterium]